MCNIDVGICLHVAQEWKNYIDARLLSTLRFIDLGNLKLSFSKTAFISNTQSNTNESI
jgi:hypothetical protein